MDQRLILPIGVGLIAWETFLGVTSLLLLDEHWKWIPIFMLVSNALTILNSILYVTYGEDPDGGEKFVIPGILGLALKLGMWVTWCIAIFKFIIPHGIKIAMHVAVWSELAFIVTSVAISLWIVTSPRK